MTATARTRATRYVIRMLLLLGLMALVIVAGCGGSGSALKYSFTKGEKFTYDLQVVMNGTMAAPGVAPEEGTIPKDSTIKARFSLEVTDVKDKVATIVYTYESMEMIAEGQTETVPADKLPKVTVKMDEYGKVVSVDGATGGLLGGLMGGDSSLPIDPSQLSGSAFVGLPPSGKLAVGEEWSTTTDYPIPGLGQSVQATTKAKITSLAKEGDSQLVSFDYSLDLPMDLTIDLAKLVAAAMQATSETMPADLKLAMTLKGSESYKGTSTVNLTKGVPVAFDADGTMKVTFAITEAPEEMIPQDERGPFDMDISMKITLAQVK